MIAVEPLLHQHAERFGAAQHVFQAPGRVNLIGEHTDYTGGLVMPAAIDFNTVAAVSAATDSKSTINSVNFKREFQFDAGAIPAKPKRDWTDYPLGVLWSLRESGITAPQFNMTLAGDVPLGAGLSSSASVEVAVVFAALALADATMPRIEIALACKRAENGFVGAQSGIMDQYIACCGVKDHALMIDTRDLTSRAVPLPPDVRLVICNTMVKHSHAGGEYNQRRKEVEEGTRAIQQVNPSIRELRDATLEDLEAARSKMSDDAFRRCRHIITENARVQEAVAALAAGNMQRMGQLMAEAHASYRVDFQASCREADLLVELANQQPGIIGARLTGGGFGGCTVNLVEATHAEEFRKAIHDAYLQRSGIDADIYLCQAAAGASEVAPA
jgi:galactokinase